MFIKSWPVAPLKWQRAKEAMKTNTKKKIIFIFLLSLAVQLVYLFFNPLSIPKGDFCTYDIIASNIVNGRGFSIDGINPVSLPPLHPIFLSLIYKIFGHNYFIAQLFLSLSFAITCIIIYLLGRDVFNAKTGFIAAMFISFYPPLFGLSRLILTESLLMLFLYTSIFLLLFFLRINKPRLLFLSSILLGAAILTRPQIFYFPVAIIVFLFWLFPLKKAISFTLLFTFGILLCLAPWAIHNYIVFKDFRPLGGFAIQSGKFKAIDCQSVYNKETHISRISALQEQTLKEYYAKAKINLGMQAKNNFLHRAISYFGSDYTGNPSNALDLIRKMYITSYGDILDIGIPFKAFSDDRNILKAYWHFFVIKTALILISFFLFLFGFLGMILSLGKDKKTLLLILLFASYTIFFYLWVKLFGQIGICGRYGIPVLPILVLFAADLLIRANSKIRHSFKATDGSRK